MLGNYVTEYPVSETFSSGDFFFVVVILISSYNFNEKRIPET